jgi:hypothetical protein
MLDSFSWFKMKVDEILNKEREGSSSIRFTVPREHVVYLDNREVVNLAHNERIVFVEFANGDIARYDISAKKDWQLRSNARVL